MSGCFQSKEVVLKIKRSAFGLITVFGLVACTSIQRLEQSRLDNSARFGHDIDIMSLAIVGAPQESNQEAEGAAYLYQRIGDTWSIKNRLESPDPDDEEFGSAVAIGSSLAAVGAPLNNLPGAVSSGSVYIYQRTGYDWNHVQTLSSPLPHQAWEAYGNTIAIDGLSLVVGAVNRDQGGVVDAGAAFVYQWNGTQYVLIDSLAASAPEASDFFGAEVEIKRDTIAVSAIGRDVRGDTDAGSVYIYKSIRNNFLLSQTLVAGDAAENDLFGTGLSIYEYGDRALTLVVGAEGKDVNGLKSAGAAYIYDAPPMGAFSETDKLVASDGGPNDHFGTDVAIWNQRIVVGASGEDNFEIDAGAAYAYVLEKGSWIEDGKLIATNTNNQSALGAAVAMRGAHTLIGATGTETNPGETNSGVVRMFARPTTASAWHFGQTLTAARTSIGDNYGRALGLDGDDLIISGSNVTDIYQEDTNAFSLEQTIQSQPSSIVVSASIDDETAVVFGRRVSSMLPIGYLEIFTRQGSTWASQQFIEPDLVSAAQPDESANSSVVTIKDDTIAVGARRWNGGDGRVFIYTRAGNNWSQQQLIMSPNQVGNFDLNFGNHVRIDGDWLAVAEVPSSGVPQSPKNGNVFLYQLISGQYVLQQVLTEPLPSALDKFGVGLAMHNNLLAVYGASSQTLRVYQRVNGIYSEIWNLVVPDVGPSDTGLALLDNFVAIGVKNADFNSAVDVGAVRVFERQPDNTYAQHKVLRVNLAEPGLRLGATVEMDSTKIVASTDGNNSVSSRVYIFDW